MKNAQKFTPHSSYMDLKWTTQVWAAHNLIGSWKMTSHIHSINQIYIYKTQNTSFDWKGHLHIPFIELGQKLSRSNKGQAWCIIFSIKKYWLISFCLMNNHVSLDNIIWQKMSMNAEWHISVIKVMCTLSPRRSSSSWADTPEGVREGGAWFKHWLLITTNICL
jgi:hypothetical protein